MLNNGGIIKKAYGAPDSILFAVEHQVSMGVKVAQSVGTAKDGKKIAMRGTVLTGDLDARTTAFTKGSGEDAVGILLHDVDVTAGDANGAILLFGFVNKNRLESAEAEAIDETVEQKLPMIKFVAC